MACSTAALKKGDSAVGIVSETEKTICDFARKNFITERTRSRREAGVSVGLIYFTTEHGAPNAPRPGVKFRGAPDCTNVPGPQTDFLLDGLTRAGVKMLLNALSTCTMVRLGRVMGNYMIWVVPSNLKLIDRATRYIQRLTGLDYQAANRLLFEVIEYVEPRMKADQAYPPVVGVAVMRARHQLTNEQAEERLKSM